MVELHDHAKALISVAVLPWSQVDPGSLGSWWPLGRMSVCGVGTWLFSFRPSLSISSADMMILKVEPAG